MSSTVQESVDAIELKSYQYESRRNPEYHGGADERAAYGGWLTAFGIRVASSTVDVSQYNVYSVTGNFLGTSNTAQKIKAHVTPLRDTKTFVTRRVDLYQSIGGRDRTTVTMIVDFHRPESASMLTYSASPVREYSTVEASLSSEDQMRMAEERGAHDMVVRDFSRRFRNFFAKFERRVPPEGVLGQVLTMMTPLHPGPMDKQAMPERTTAEYFKSKVSLNSHLENVLAIAYLQDSVTPFIPASFGKITYKQIAAAGSLDFALRIFSNDLDLTKWVLKEETTMVAAEGRTYVEGRMWDGNGKMLASLTEQCILRPAPTAAKM